MLCLTGVVAFVTAGCGDEGAERFSGKTNACGYADPCDSTLEYCYVAVGPDKYPDVATDYWCEEYDDCFSCDCLVDPHASYESCEEDESGITVTFYGF